MRIQVDVDFWMTKSWIWVSFTSNNSFMNNFRWHFGYQIDGPSLVGLLFFANKSCSTDVVFIPDLTSMSDLLIQNLQVNFET